MTRRTVRPWLLGALLLAGCAVAPEPPESMRDPTADFASYRTFGWSPAPAAEGQDEPLRLLDRNLRAAIADELRRKGYVESAESPDLRLAYETASQQKVENRPVRIGVGVGGWGGNVGGSVNVGSPSVRSYQEGTLVIHAIDSSRNAEVWQGRISSRMSKQGGLEAAAVAEAVRAALRDFPARP